MAKDHDRGGLVASTGPQAPASVVDAMTGLPWTDLSECLTANGVYATIELAEAEGSSYSLLQWPDFGVPDEATITGVRIGYLAYQSVGFGPPHQFYTMLQNNYVNIGTLTGTASLPGAPAYTYIGGATNLLGAALTPAIANSGTLGIRSQAITLHGTTFFWDYVDMEIFYSEGGGTSKNRTSVNQWSRIILGLG